MEKTEKENNAIVLDILNRLSSLDEELSQIAEAETGFEEKAEEIRQVINHLYEIQSSLQRDIQKWSGLLDRVNEALDAMTRLTAKVDALEAKLDSLDLQKVVDAADEASTSIEKAVSTIAKEKQEKEKGLRDAAPKKKVPTNSRRKV